MSMAHDSQRRLSMLDQCLGLAQQALQQAIPSGREEADTAPRPAPAAESDDTVLASIERRHAAGLMRVNHAGEIAAQALYQGQSATARDPAIRQHLQQAAAEERDHLDWCSERVRELGEQTSALEPLWYAGSWLIGALAGLAGDRVSLGFVAETERQVAAHLQGHLDKLPADDAKSRAILQQMLDDETRHGNEALELGGVELPGIVQRIMRRTARVMTKSAYYL